MITTKPTHGQSVEILVSGQWKMAKFIAWKNHQGSDDYFLLENGNTVPEDPDLDDYFPEWRPCDKTWVYNHMAP
jgi:hypothetical protein